MATPEQPTPPPQEKEARDRGLAIVATPGENEKVLFQRSEDGGMTIKFEGKVAIALSPKVAEASGAVLTDTAGVPYGLIPEGSPPPQSEPQKESSNGSSAEPEEIFVPESENKKFEFIGNPVYDAKYRERKSGKRIADFHIATHPEKNKTEYYRIRAFDGLAERARDTVRKGQKGVEVVAYGPKYWKGKRKTENGWKEELIEGYYAGFVNVPSTSQKDSPANTEKEPSVSPKP
jgi:Single-strand binding protein family